MRCDYCGCFSADRYAPYGLPLFVCKGCYESLKKKYVKEKEK